ncbi:hypothetical protein Taro_051422, partial [Colocasia esculenta]|nr:hypothetical protein [Colocasia esculenta]
LKASELKLAVVEAEKAVIVTVLHEAETWGVAEYKVGPKFQKDLEQYDTACYEVGDRRGHLHATMEYAHEAFNTTLQECRQWTQDPHLDGICFASFQSGRMSSGAEDVGPLKHVSHKLSELKSFDQSGTADPDEAEKWLKEIEHIFHVIQCTDGDKLLLATFQLERDARAWWESVEATRAEAQFTWNEFKEHFNSKYFSERVQERKASEFATLKQRNLSVAEYEAQFSWLAPYANHLVGESDGDYHTHEEGNEDDAQE